MKKILVAYSGGLDTSCIVHWLKNKYNAEVYAYCGDILGLSAKEKREIEKKAIKSGAKKVFIEDLRDEFLRDFAFLSLKAGAVYEEDYFLATALGRPLLAKKLVEKARKLKIKTVAHGCTAKGNDQVRFEVSIYALAGDIEILAPVRFWEFKTREEEVAYARANKIPVAQVSKKYSIDENLWGCAIECGELEDPQNSPPESAWQWTGKKLKTKPAKLSIVFRKGVPVSVNGKKMPPIKIVEFLNKLAGSYKIGRSDLVESRIVGIKSREIYEAPAAFVLNKAHFDLERLVFGRELLHYKEKVSKDFANMVYGGRWFSPLREALTAFVEKTQDRVTGTVHLLLRPYSAAVTGRTSPFSLYKKELATYSKGDAYRREFAEGFIKLYGMDIAKK